MNALAPLQQWMNRNAAWAGGLAAPMLVITILVARHLLHAQHRTRAGGDDGGVLHAAPTGLLGVPHRAAAHHAAAFVAQRGLHPCGAARRSHGPGCGRRGDRGLWPLLDRWQLRGRFHRVRDPGGDQLHRDHQGLGAHCRGVGPLHAGRHARQTDGDRRRPERRGARKWATRPSSSAPWTVRPSSCGATPSPAS